LTEYDKEERGEREREGGLGREERLAGNKRGKKLLEFDKR
jgi:hypothetical protein